MLSRVNVIICFLLSASWWRSGNLCTLVDNGLIQHGDNRVAGDKDAAHAGRFADLEVSSRDQALERAQADAER